MYIRNTSPEANMIVSVNPDTHKRITHLMQTSPVEYGGTLKFNAMTHTLDIDKESPQGIYDQVNIPAGLVQFHTHQQLCTATKCTIPLPSATDLKSFATAVANKDTLVHLIYSEDGVYSILMQPRFLHALQNEKGFVNKFCSLSDTTFNAVTDHFLANRDDYPRFQKEWMQISNVAGFNIRLTALDTAPTFIFDKSLIAHLRGSQ